MLDEQADGWFAIIIAKRRAHVAVFIHRQPRINALLRNLSTGNWAEKHLIEKAIAGNSSAKMELSQQIALESVRRVKDLTDSPQDHSEIDVLALGMNATLISHLVKHNFLVLVEAEDGSVDLKSIPVSTIDEARQSVEENLLEPMNITTRWDFQTPDKRRL